MMATRAITTCDICEHEIKPGERILYFTASRLRIDGAVVAEFGSREFCGEACVIKAVRALLNGDA